MRATSFASKTLAAIVGVLLVFLFLIVGQTGCRHRQKEAVAGRNLLPKDVLKILENADEFTLFSLEPEPLFVPQSLKSTNRFHGYPVLGKLEIHDPKQRNEILNALYPALSKDATRYWCFNPRHGIQARAGKDTEDLVICFECGLVCFYGSWDGKVPVLGTPASAFNRVLSDAQVPLSKQTPGE